VAVSYIGGCNRGTWRKLLTCRVSHNVASSTPRHERDVKHQKPIIPD